MPTICPTSCQGDGNGPMYVCIEDIFRLLTDDDVHIC